MGYALIPLITSVILVVPYVFVSDASRGSKLSVLVIVLTSLVIWRYFPAWSVVATLLQVAAGVYMLVHAKLMLS